MGRFECSHGGFTLLETVVAIALLGAAMLGVYGTVVVTSDLHGLAFERDKAYAAAQAKSDELWRTPIADVFTSFGSGSPGEWFAVTGLGVPGGRTAVGRVVLLRESTTGGGASLPDRGAEIYFGVTLDMNEDGDVIDAPVDGAAVYVVAIELAWVSDYDGTQTTLVFPVVLGTKIQDEGA